MAIELIPGSTAGMVFYPGEGRVTGRRLLRLLAWAVTGVPPHDRPHRPQTPESAWEAGPQAEQDGTAGSTIDMLALYARNDHARQVVAGFAAEVPFLSGLWQEVDRALADVPRLGAACARMTAELAGVRAERANLIAAMRAALAASAEGEYDPLFYLRDELTGQQALSHSPGGDHDDA